MNIHAPLTPMRAALDAIEERYPLRILGRLPRGAAVHVLEDEALDLLAKKRRGLSLLQVAQAEAELAERLGRPVGIVMTSEVRGQEATRLTEALQPL